MFWVLNCFCFVLFIRFGFLIWLFYVFVFVVMIVTLCFLGFELFWWCFSGVCKLGICLGVRCVALLFCFVLRFGLDFEC